MYLENKHLRTLFITAFFISIRIFAQPNTVRSPKDSLKILFDTASNYVLNDLDKAEKDFKELLQLAIDNNDHFWEAKSLYQLSYINKLKGGENSFKDAIVYGKQALANFRRSGDSLEVFNTLVHINGVYVVNERIEEALTYSLKAEKLIPILQNKISANDKGKFYGNLALVYYELNLYQKSIKSNTKALKSFDKAKNDSGKFLVYNNLGNIYNNLHNSEKSFDYFKKAYTGFKKLGATRYLATCASNLGDAAIMLDSINLSKEYLEEAIELANIYKYPNVSVSANFFMAKALYEENNLDSAHDFLDQSIKIADSMGRLDRKVDALMLSQKIAERKGNLEEAYTYTQQIERLKTVIDSINNKNQAVTTLINTKRPSEEEKINYTLIILIFGLVSLLVLISFMLYKKKQNKLSIVNDQLLANFRKASKEKDKLSRKVVTLTALHVRREKSLKQINQILDDIKIESSDASPLKENLQQAKQIVRGQISLEKRWDIFFKHFEEVHPSFLETLNSQYALSATDIKVCAFLKMNLSNYEISEILGINQKSIHVLLHRLKKKLNLPSDITINQFLSTI